MSHDSSTPRPPLAGVDSATWSCARCGGTMIGRQPASGLCPTCVPQVARVLDAFEALGYHRGDDAHVAAAVAYLLPLLELYTGERDGLNAPGVAQPGGGWLSGPSS